MHIQIKNLGKVYRIHTPCRHSLLSIHDARDTCFFYITYVRTMAKHISQTIKCNGYDYYGFTLRQILVSRTVISPGSTCLTVFVFIIACIE